MSKMVHGVLIDPINNIAKETDLSGTLNGYYEALHCDCFDIASRKIGGRYYDIYCDDEGLLKQNPIISATTPNGEPMLVGALFVCDHNMEGDTISIAHKQCEKILDHVVCAHSNRLKPNDINPVLVCEY